MPVFTIIIPTYNRNDDLRSCLQSIMDNSFYQNEVIVLHAQIDLETNSICKEFNVVSVFDNARKNSIRVKSLWGILNEGIVLASSNFVLYLNDDCLVEPNWDKNALPYFTNKTALLVLKTKGIGNDPEYRVVYGKFGIPCANYGIIDKRFGILFDENFNWFYGDADFPLQVLNSPLQLSVLCSEENMIVHNHRKDENRERNETDTRAIQDETYYHKKWDSYTFRNGHVYKKNWLDVSYDFFCKCAKKLTFRRLFT